MNLQPFSLNIESQDIQDLKERLQRTCWPGSGDNALFLMVQL
ncbi:hypothetical protein [Paenibacillus terrae]|nr:hypothetical protein [Paenibacillus terrae]